MNKWNWAAFWEGFWDGLTWRWLWVPVICYFHRHNAEASRRREAHEVMQAIRGSKLLDRLLRRAPPYVDEKLKARYDRALWKGM